ncbi:DUF2157 domain-containing protein [Lutibacter sp. TH_r2]|uniref:DUF2157 domain-containing protein n=1 Tax=Lutibacter sp. TH_r2 TaxID=3082083 RepID=UPI002954EBDD|nr:DUF2157 domain-containing protein [Lutibacter sp. TH_r2]MDV7186386.1 DUF2157 domain-containing protein [Lutibacter sp. TH_r2]
MSVLKDLNELISNGIITKEIASNIENYYNSKKSDSTNKLFIVFGILGAILVGLGIILILAHNWDNLSRFTKTILAFTPLLIGQLICGYVLLTKRKNVAWRESASTFLFFSVGASISLVSQIYNIPGNINTFVLTWMLLCLPLVYLLKSSITSLLYIIGITYFACNSSYWSYPNKESYEFWLLLILIIPHYYNLFKNSPKGNFLIFHNWFIPLSIIITLGTLSHNYEKLMYLVYISLFGLYLIIGETDYFKNNKLRNNSYKVLGSVGTLITLLILSFNEFWGKLQTVEFIFLKLLDYIEIATIVIITCAAVILFFIQKTYQSIKNSSLIEYVFLLFIPIFLVGLYSSISVILINLLIFIIGILTIKKGSNLNHLGVLNFGLILITVLVICRFFDTDLSFVLRGLLFVSVGAGFFIANYLMLKKRKNEK